MAESSIDNSPRIIVGNLKTHSKKSKWLKWAAPVIVVVVLAGVAYVHYKNGPPYATESCAKSKNQACILLKEAVTELDPSKTDKLAKTADKIKQLKNYQKDPNLMYVLTVYYINAADSKDAHSAYDSFAKVYDKDVGYDDVLLGKTVLPSDLKQQVNFIDVQIKAAQQNANGFKEPN